MGSIKRRPRCWTSTMALARLDEHETEALKKKWLNLSNFNATALKKRRDVWVCASTFPIVTLSSLSNGPNSIFQRKEYHHFSKNL
ncbi:hypothetical protein HN51_019737, partial [Arachis hypogaea]